MTTSTPPFVLRLQNHELLLKYVEVQRTCKGLERALAHYTRLAAIIRAALESPREAPA
jgi:hypothetical protein